MRESRALRWTRGVVLTLLVIFTALPLYVMVA
jgi:quinol-cytochrome oxidoreductase complex cytochrome b subunit